MLLETALVVMMNAQRIKPLVIDSRLEARAEIRANVLCATGLWTHTGYEAYFAGLKWSYAGENLAKGYTGAADTFNAWMASPEHRANILNEHYGRVGIAKACDVTVELFTN